jgi:hypothetical protein
MPHLRYSAEEVARRAKQIYEERIRAQVETGNKGKVLVIDIETGEYELDQDHLVAAKRALARHPGAALFALRIGYPAMGRIGLVPVAERRQSDST